MNNSMANYKRCNFSGEKEYYRIWYLLSGSVQKLQIPIRPFPFQFHLTNSQIRQNQKLSGRSLREPRKDSPISF